MADGESPLWIRDENEQSQLLSRQDQGVEDSGRRKASAKSLRKEHSRFERSKDACKSGGGKAEETTGRRQTEAEARSHGASDAIMRS